MKHSLFLVIATIAVISMVLFSSCKSEDEKEIDKAIATYITTHPISKVPEDDLLITKIERSGKYIAIFFDVYETEGTTVGDIRLLSTSTREIAKQAIKGDELISFAKSKGYGCKYVYKGLQTKDTFECVFEASEL